PVEYHPLATDAATGEAVDLAPFIRDVPSLRDVLRASTRLPVLGGPLIEIEGRQFLDAGLAENVPVTTAFAQGATHVLALRTQQPREFRPRPSRLEDRVVRTWLSRRAPGALGAWTARHERVLAEERLLATDPRVRQIAPPESAPSVGLLSRTTETLRQAVAIGRAAVDEVLGERTEGGTPPGSGSPRL
ncbi:MAG: patatin family protein, partial [Intrasporangiaceae bacterium]|nr:patatin family protein [Intrasporangiaceae bacterium]